MGRTHPPNTGLRIEGPSSGVKRLPPRTRYAPSNGPPPGPAAVGSRGLKGISLHVVPSSHVACLPALRRAVDSLAPLPPRGGEGAVWAVVATSLSCCHATLSARTTPRCRFASLTCTTAATTADHTGITSPHVI